MAKMKGEEDDEAELTLQTLPLASTAKRARKEETLIGFGEGKKRNLIDGIKGKNRVLHKSNSKNTPK